MQNRFKKKSLSYVHQRQMQQALRKKKSKKRKDLKQWLIASLSLISKCLTLMDVTRVEADIQRLHVVNVGSSIFMKSVLGEAAFQGA